MTPAARIADAFKAFGEAFPTVALRLSTETLGAVTQLVVSRSATIGICGPLDTGLDGLEYIGVGAVRVIPVASPDHPLAKTGNHEPGALRQHVQLVLTDRSSLTEGQDFAVVSNQTWRLADLGSKLVLLREGIGWGTMPEPMVRDDIAAGRLVHLRMPETVGGVYDLRATYRTDSPPGPAGQWMISRFQGQVT
jgi:DNA-binding transcriptional LysR family regulator